jgi:diaminopimelate epimerase
MRIEFFKFQGAGNDFIMLDNRQGSYADLSLKQVIQLCDRHFGIGSDGLISINSNDNSDFFMDFFNPDGTKSFCGNGARCAVAFFDNLVENKKKTYTFQAIDGFHEASIKVDNLVRLLMNDVQNISMIDKETFEINTGSPHLIKFCEEIDTLNVKDVGSKIRYSEKYKNQGINVNFIEIEGKAKLKIRTYERGVENETLACGTGITAAALAYYFQHKKMDLHKIQLEARGGSLIVEFDFEENSGFKNIYLTGPAEFIFKGEVHV